MFQTQFLCPSSRVFYCTHSNGVCHTGLLCVQWKTPVDGQRNCLKHVEFYSKNKFEKLVHLVGFIIRIYHDARSPEQKIWGTLFILTIIWPMAETKFCVISFDCFNSFNYSLICNSVKQALQHVSYINCNAKFWGCVVFRHYNMWVIFTVCKILRFCGFQVLQHVSYSQNVEVMWFSGITTYELYSLFAKFWGHVVFRYYNMWLIFTNNAKFWGYVVFRYYNMRVIFTVTQNFEVMWFSFKGQFMRGFRPALGPTQPPVKWVLGLSQG